jgi:hypothetical protein
MLLAVEGRNRGAGWGGEEKEGRAKRRGAARAPPRALCAGAVTATAGGGGTE